MPKYIYKHRRGTAEKWSNTTIIPLAGEIVVEIDEVNHLHKLKIGDGKTPYADLAYLKAGDEIVSQVLAEAKPRVVTVELSSNWIKGADDKYSQVIDLTDITEYSRLDLQPSADMLAEFKQLGLVFVTENNAGTITVYSVGNMPLKTYTMQATIVETDVVASCDKIMGIPVGTPTANADWEQTDETKADYIKNKPAIKSGSGENSVNTNLSSVVSTEDISNLTFTYVTKTDTGYEYNISPSSFVNMTLSMILSRQENYVILDNIEYEILKHNFASAQASSTVTPYIVTKRPITDEQLGVEIASVTFKGIVYATITGKFSHNEGGLNTIEGNYSHTEGTDNKIYNNYSHAEGKANEIYSDYSHAEGIGTITTKEGSHVEGTYNLADEEEKYLHIVGNGTSARKRSNAHTLDTDGNAWFQGEVKIGGVGQDDENAKTLATKEYVDKAAYDSYIYTFENQRSIERFITEAKGVDISCNNMCLVAVTNTTDPQFIHNFEVPMDGRVYKYIKVKYKTTSVTPTNTILFFATENTSYGSATRGNMQLISTDNDGWITGLFDLSNNTYWNSETAEPIKNIRFDIPNSIAIGDEIHIKYVGLFSTIEEVNSFETLATQNYVDEKVGTTFKPVTHESVSMTQSYSDDVVTRGDMTFNMLQLDDFSWPSLASDFRIKVSPSFMEGFKQFYGEKTSFFTQTFVIRTITKPGGTEGFQELGAMEWYNNASLSVDYATNTFTLNLMGDKLEGLSVAKFIMFIG